MKSTILTIFQKEFKRFFSDRRMVFTTIIMPGLIIFLMYNLMGGAIASQFTDIKKPVVQAVHVPQSLRPALQQAFELTEIEADGQDEAKRAVQDKNLSLLAVFPADFDSAVAAYDAQSGLPAPGVQLFYNSSGTNSQQAFSAFSQVLTDYEATMTNKFDINPATDTSYDLASKQDLTGTIFSSMLPMLLLVFLFSGCMAVAPESIAGEKDRGTIATMLVTPAKRGDIALGKIFALSIIALLSGISSAAGTILSLPKLMGAAGELDGSAYTIADYVLLGVVILSTVLVLITLISIISAFAKTAKEAQTYIMPLMLVVVLVGVTAMFNGGAQTELFWYFIPLYNTVQCMISIFSFAIVPAQLAVTVVTNLIVTALGAFVLTKMFNSEKVMFSK